MDFELPEELRMFQQSLRRFVDSELFPMSGRPRSKAAEIKPEYYERFSQRAKVSEFSGRWSIRKSSAAPEVAAVLARSIVEQELSRSIAFRRAGMGGIAGRLCAPFCIRSKAR